MRTAPLLRLLRPMPELPTDVGPLNATWRANEYLHGADERRNPFNSVYSVEHMSDQPAKGIESCRAWCATPEPRPTAARRSARADIPSPCGGRQACHGHGP